MSSRLVPPCVALLLLSLACSVIADPSREVVLLDQTYMFGPCSREWSPVTPPAERTVVDVFFRGEDGSPPATWAQMAIVRAAGGTNLYGFNLPIVRAELDVDAMHELVGRGSSATAVGWAKTVVDPADRTVELIVGLSRDITDADIAAVEALGASVRSRWDFIDAYFVEINDTAVPQVRALPGVSSVHGNGIGCFG